MTAEQQNALVSGEPFLTMNEVAERLGLPYWKFQRAVARGIFPYYCPCNRRKLFLISDVVAVIARTRCGGEQ